MLVETVLKNLSFLFYLSLFSFTSVAQVNLGIQAGGNLSTMDFTYNDEYKNVEVNYTSGFIGGIVAQFISRPHAGIQAELNFSQKGWIQKDTTMGNNIKYDNKLDYIELPILSHINIGSGDFRGLFNIGPYIGYALNRKGTVTDLNTGESETYDYTFDTDLDNRIDFGLLVGLGVEYRFSFGKVAAETRYSFGFSDLDKRKIRQSEVSQFRVLGVLLRYTVPLNAKASKAKTDPQ